ncbi:glycosyltransferase family 9 protein [Nocardiopsis xinjiangensis]|uniref:glycosyltransferase family 9 protein n=1 Tax=Nocardiopsis xinjiangensis TaxID=124285 RepID=UPI0003751033
MTRSPRLLAVRALGLGDFVTAVPALRALERALPDHVRVLAGPAWYRDLVRSAGLGWRVLPTEALRTPEWEGPAPELAVNLHGRGPQSTAAVEALGPGQLWSYAHPDAPGAQGPPWPGAVHDCELWCALLEYYGVPADAEDVRWTRPAGVGDRDDTVIVHPGAASGSRRWPAERFAQVARRLQNRGFRVLVTGSSGERALAERVATEAGLWSGSVVAGRTGLRLLLHLVSRARLLVCGDTGVAHVATAYVTPSVRLYGPVSPALWGPLVDTDVHACLWSGRRGEPHAEHLDPGLAELTVDAVWQRCERLLGRGQSLTKTHQD